MFSSMGGYGLEPPTSCLLGGATSPSPFAQCLVLQERPLRQRPATECPCRRDELLSGRCRVQVVSCGCCRQEILERVAHRQAVEFEPCREVCQPGLSSRARRIVWR